MPTFRLKSFVLAIVGCCSLCCFTGCLAGRGIPLLSRAPQVEEFRIDYSLPSAAKALSDWSIRNSEFVTASWQDDEPQGDFSDEHRAATLNIEYPHPEKGTDSALATLKLYDSPSTDVATAEQANVTWIGRLNPMRVLRRSPQSPGSIPTEILTMEVPRAQFEMLMSDLNRDSYPDAAKNRHTVETGGVTLSIARNDHPVHHSTVSEPRLDEFMRRVYRDGEILIGHRSQPNPILTTSATHSAPNPLESSH